jgi:hypothetical protein
MKKYAIVGGAVCLLVAISGCPEEVGSRPLMATGSDGSTDGGGDGSMTMPGATLSYTPEGCDYEVVTPEVAEAERGSAEIGPSPTPSLIHVSYAGPSHSSFAVNWQTDEETKVSTILYGTDEGAVGSADASTADVMEQNGHQVLFIDLLEGRNRIHEVHVCGLDPATTYYYKVGGPGAWSEVFDVATAPMPGATDSFRFAVTGDSRNDSVVWADTQEQVQSYAVDFEIFSGDAVLLGVNQPEWAGFFGETATSGDFEVQDLIARVPLFPANGNHDGLAINYVLQFALPQQADTDERAQGEEWYSFDYGSAHFVVLNDSAGDQLNNNAQRDFLEADLAAVDRSVTPWLFAVHHFPPYSCSTNHGSNVDLRAAWQPLYDTYEVDIVFNGHDHDYERSLPIRGFQEGTNDGVVADHGSNGVPIDRSGTIYIVAAGAGAPLYGVDPSCFHTHATESVRNYVIVDIDGLTLTYTAYRLDGSVLDEFTYTKSE